MATTDFRFRVSKAVGSPSVQGAASMETLANHTENPGPHPQYMRKSYVGLGFDLTSHLANRLHHAGNFALRDELMTSKLDYERQKNASLVHDPNNYMATTGVKAHVVTAYVLNQILKDVGLDGSAEALTYSNLVNTYDTKVTVPSRYAPTWEIFLKLKNSISDWLTYSNPNDFIMKSSFKEWVEYMYGEYDGGTNFHPLRPGLKVTLYASDYITESKTTLPQTTVGAVDSAYLADRRFVPNITDSIYRGASYIIVQTSDTVPVTGKTYYYISGNTTNVFTGSTFTSGVTYYEKIYVDLKKVQGACLTCGCSILEKCCMENDQTFFDWSNGLEWNYFAGDITHANTNPYAHKLMVWEGRIKLSANQKIVFAGVADDAVFLQIGSNILTRQDNNDYWHHYQDYYTEGSYEDVPHYEFVANSTGLYTFKLAIFNKILHGPRTPANTGAYSSDIPFRMSIDGGTTFLPISNESLAEPIFFLQDGSEKEITYTKEVRDRNNYRPDPKPGLLVRMWKSAAVSQSGTIDVYAYESGTRHTAELKHLNWSSTSFHGDSNPSNVDRTWSSFLGPYITNGCSMLAKCCNINDPSFFDWFNGQDWTYYSGSNIDSINHPWAKRTVGWFGMIYLRKGETVKFKGYVEDFHWIKIDDTWVVDGQGCSDVEPTVVHTYTATYTGYHPFKLITRNQTYVGPKMATNDYYLQMAINDDNFVDITNESFTVPRFFLPEDCDQKMFWNEGVVLRDRYAIREMSDKIAEYEQRFIRALSTVNHVPDWNTRVACTGVLNTTDKTLTWTVPEGISHGTLNLMFAAESSNGTDSGSQTQPGVLSVKMPGLGAQWVEVTYLATFHSTTKYDGQGSNSFGRYECNMTFRVISGMQFQLSRVASVLHDHSCTIEDYEPEPSS